MNVMEIQKNVHYVKMVFMEIFVNTIVVKIVMMKKMKINIVKKKMENVYFVKIIYIIIINVKKIVQKIVK